MSLLERLDVPEAKSRASTSATRQTAGGGVERGARADDAAADDQDCRAHRQVRRRRQCCPARVPGLRGRGRPISWTCPFRGGPVVRYPSGPTPRRRNTAPRTSDATVGRAVTPVNRDGVRHRRTRGLGCGAMPGTIQSIERAAAMLRLLGSAGRPLALAEIAAPLDLPTARPRTASCARCARSGSSTRTATPAATPSPPALRRLGSEWDRHDLRSRAMNWADSLAGSAGQEVLLGMPAGCRGRARAPRLPARRLAASACGRASSSRCTPRPSASACSPSRRSPCPGRTSSSCSATPDAP